VAVGLDADTETRHDGMIAPIYYGVMQ